MWRACSPGGIPLSESLSSTPAGVCSRETVPTSWRFVSLSSALADWAAAGRTSAVASKAVTLTVRAHFRMLMPGLLDTIPQFQLFRAISSLAGTAESHRLGTFISAASVILFRWRNCFLLQYQRGGLKRL